MSTVLLERLIRYLNDWKKNQFLQKLILHNLESGLTPDADLHMTILDIEPITGMTVSAHKRIQVTQRIFAVYRDGSFSLF